MVFPDIRHGSMMGVSGDNRGEAPITCSLRLLNGLALDFRLQGVRQTAEGGAATNRDLKDC